MICDLSTNGYKSMNVKKIAFKCFILNLYGKLATIKTFFLKKLINPYEIKITFFESYETILTRIKQRNPIN